MAGSGHCGLTNGAFGGIFRARLPRWGVWWIGGIFRIAAIT